MTPSLRVRSLARILMFIAGASLFMSSATFASTQPWEQASFAADPQAVLSAAKAIQVGKDADVDVFLAERRYVIDEQGCVTRTTHWVYRVNTNDGVKNWADVGAGWEPWHQLKPEINVRVITPDGGVHMLDPKTLVDAPSRGNAEATFEDDRSYHGPIPAVGLGAIIDEYIVVRDTSPFFEGGMVGRFWFGSSVPIQQSRFVIETPAGMTFRPRLWQRKSRSMARFG